MNIDIKATNDEFFSIGTVDHVITKPLSIEEVKPNQTNVAPLDNSREGHPFDPFGGTSWAGKKQGFN